MDSDNVLFNIIMAFKTHFVHTISTYAFYFIECMICTYISESILYKRLNDHEPFRKQIALERYAARIQ